MTLNRFDLKIGHDDLFVRALAFGHHGDDGGFVVGDGGFSQSSRLPPFTRTATLILLLGKSAGSGKIQARNIPQSLYVRLPHEIWTHF